MVHAKRRPLGQAYEVFPRATPGDIARLGLVIVESDAMGGRPIWGRYVADGSGGRTLNRKG